MTRQGEEAAMGPETDLQAFAAAQARGAFAIDVSEPGEHLQGHIPGARPMPLPQVLARQSELPRDQPVYVVSSRGSRSGTVAGWLRGRGFDAVSVKGGTSAWVAQGRAVTQGMQDART